MSRRLSNDVTNVPLEQSEINAIEEFRRSKKTAVLAIIFTDIVGSTAAAEKLGENTYNRLRHIHDELFIRIVTRDNAGVIIKEIGDSFLCVFSEPSTAVLRAIEFQDAIRENKINFSIRGYTLEVRIGIHLGQVAVEDNLSLDIFGRQVNRAARVMSIAEGGQVLTTQSIWENASGWLKDNKNDIIYSRAFGKAVLKGIKEKVEIFEFYKKAIGSKGYPKTLKRREILRMSSIVLSTLLILLLIILAVMEFNPFHVLRENVINDNHRKGKCYLQVDFTDSLKVMSDSMRGALKGEVLSGVIKMYSPDTVVVEEQVEREFYKMGRKYVRHELWDFWFYYDTLGCRHAITLNISPILAHDNTSYKFDGVMNWYGIKDSITGYGAVAGCWGTSKLPYLVGQFINCLANGLQKEKINPPFTPNGGEVLYIKNDKLVIKLSKYTPIQVGQELDVFKDSGDTTTIIKMFESMVSYFHEHGKYRESLREINNNYDKSKKEYITRWIPIGIRVGTARVSEIYDSTAIATITSNHNNAYPWLKIDVGNKWQTSD